MSGSTTARAVAGWVPMALHRAMWVLGKYAAGAGGSAGSGEPDAVMSCRRRHFAVPPGRRRRGVSGGAAGTLSRHIGGPAWPGS